jgi:hypothetical protein
MKKVLISVYGNIMVVILTPFVILGTFLFCTALNVYGAVKYRSFSGDGWDMESIMREWHMKPALLTHDGKPPVFLKRGQGILS